MDLPLVDWCSGAGVDYFVYASRVYVEAGSEEVCAGKRGAERAWVVIAFDI